MNDIGVLKELIDNISVDVSSNNKLVMTLSIFIGLNLLLAILNTFIQFKLKNKDKDINSFNLREEKRINHQNDLYMMLEELSYYDGNSDLIQIEIYTNKINFINRFITKQRLFLSKDLISITNKYTDYILVILNDYNKRDYEFENQLLEKYSNIFNNGRH